MNTILIGLGCFVAGVAVSKNLRRWLTVKFWKDPKGAIEDEIAKLKALADSYRK